MLKMISTHTSSHQCGSAAVSLSPQDLQMDCNFFLTAIRLASLNQILDPWVYLLLREILLKKFCQVASAVSNCSLNVKKETQSPDALNKKAIQNENVHKQSLNMENSNLNGGQEEQWQLCKNWMGIKQGIKWQRVYPMIRKMMRWKLSVDWCIDVISVLPQTHHFFVSPSQSTHSFCSESLGDLWSERKWQDLKIMTYAGFPLTYCKKKKKYTS